jgi:hypothetical protein
MTAISLYGLMGERYRCLQIQAGFDVLPTRRPCSPPSGATWKAAARYQRLPRAGWTAGGWRSTGGWQPPGSVRTEDFRPERTEASRGGRRGLTQDQWRREWESARLFLTADGEKDKAWGNEAIRWHPDESWLEIKLLALLAHLANRPHGRYRLSCPAQFCYRGDQTARRRRHGQPRRGPGQPRRHGPHPGNPPTHEAPGSRQDQDQTTSPDHGRQPGSPRPFGAADWPGLCPASSIGTVYRQRDKVGDPGIAMRYARGPQALEDSAALLAVATPG